MLNFKPGKYLYNNTMKSVVFPSVTQIAREQALQGILEAGREKEGELATTSLEFEFHFQFPVAPRWPSWQISANQHKVETSMNVNKHWETCSEGNDIITNVFSANQHFVSAFSSQIFKFQRLSCNLSFLFLFLPYRLSNPKSLLTGCNTDDSEETIWGVKPVTFWLL